MEHTLSTEPMKIKGKVAIIALASFAAVARIGAYCFSVFNNILGAFSELVDYILNCIYRGSTINESFVEREMEYALSEGMEGIILGVLSNTFYLLLTLVPFILVILYVAFLYKKPKATVVLPISFGLLSLSSVISFVHSTINLIIPIVSDIIDYGLDIEEFIPQIIGYSVTWLLFALHDLPVAIAFALLCISSLRGFINKPITIIPSALGIVFYLLTSLFSFTTTLMAILMPFISNAHMNQSTELFLIISLIGSVVATMALVSFLIAVIILAAKNYIPEIIPMKEEKLAALAAKKPKKALAILSVRYSSGKLSEEEYNARVAEISLEE